VRTATRKPRGPSPLPRRRLNQPKFYDVVRASGTPIWLLTISARMTHATVLSKLICAESVADTPTNVERLYRIADVVGFDRSQLFLDSGQ
jgi:hypothetical protein